ncbi:MAG TPA: hypothetical protein VM677_02050, partial [Actinokineospora sp.]|nr:hypothetical protein [Actinokineospora sp.]
MPVSPARQAGAVALAAVLIVGGYSVFFSQANDAAAAVAPGSTARASVTDAGLESPNGGRDQQISGDGRSVVFSSRAELAQPVEDEARNIFVRDLVRGRTVLISRGQFTIPDPPTSSPPVPGLRSRPLLSFAAQPVPVPGETAADDDSFEPTISADGRYVAFASEASNIVPVGTEPLTLIGVDRDPDGDGDFDELKAASTAMDHRFFAISIPLQGAPSVVPSAIRLSGDGGRAVWQERVSPTDYRDRTKTAVLRSPVTGQVGTPVTAAFLPTGLDGSSTASAQRQEEPAISADGRFVVTCSEYLDGESLFSTIVRHEFATGANKRVDLEPNGTPIGSGNVEVFLPTISGDGSAVAFVAQDDEEYQPNIYLVRPDVPASELVSLDTAGQPINATMPALSADGRYLAFATDALGVHDGIDGPIRDENTDNCVVPQSDLTLVNRVMTLPPIEDRRQVRTACQVVARDLVADRERAAAGLPRLPAALASVSADEACADDGVACA